MKRVIVLVAIAGLMLMLLSLGWAATNLNSSRSNVYRMVYPADLVSQSQASALLAELDKMGPADEAKLKVWLPANFKKYGIDAARVKKISILAGRQIACTDCTETCKGKCVKGARGDCFCYEPLTSSARLKQVSKASPAVILLLSDPTDEAQALAKITGQVDGKNNN